MKLRRGPSQLDRVLALAREGEAVAAAAEKIAVVIEGSVTAPDDHKLGCPCPRCARFRQSRTDAAVARQIGGVITREDGAAS